MATIIPDEHLCHRQEMDNDDYALQPPANARSALHRSTNCHNYQGEITFSEQIQQQRTQQQQQQQTPQTIVTSKMYSPPPPIYELPQPSPYVKELLRDLFSQNATRRNLSADTIQAVMMSLDVERVEEEERIERNIANEEETMTLVRNLALEEAKQMIQPMPSSSSSSSSCAIRTTTPSYADQLTDESSNKRQIQEYNKAQYTYHQLDDSSRRQIQEYYKSQFAAAAVAAAATTATEMDNSLLLLDKSNIPERYRGSDNNERKVFAVSSTDSTNHNNNTSNSRDCQCLVCLRNTSDHQQLRTCTLSCGHSFCRSCITTWLKKKSSCPYCRQVVRRKFLRAPSA